MPHTKNSDSYSFLFLIILSLNVLRTLQYLNNRLYVSYLGSYDYTLHILCSLCFSQMRLVLDVSSLSVSLIFIGKIDEIS